VSRKNQASRGIHDKGATHAMWGSACLLDDQRRLLCEGREWRRNDPDGKPDQSAPTAGLRGKPNSKSKESHREQMVLI